MAPRSALATQVVAIPNQAAPPSCDPDTLAAAAGDGAAFARLYERYLDTVYRYVMFRLHANQRTQLAEDITAETFIRAWKSMPTYRYTGQDIGAWFVTIARNLVADHYKSAHTKRTALTGEPPSDGADPAPGPEDWALRSAFSRDVARAIGRLTADQRAVVILRYGHDLNTAETAAALGKDEGAVKACLYRATRALRRLLVEVPA